MELPDMAAEKKKRRGGGEVVEGEGDKAKGGTR